MQLLLDGRAGPYAPIFEQYQTKAEHFVSAALKRTKDHNCNSLQVHFLGCDIRIPGLIQPVGILSPSY
jgi:hypothetical protein